MECALRGLWVRGIPEEGGVLLTTRAPQLRTRRALLGLLLFGVFLALAFFEALSELLGRRAQ
jgi:hypothetical protein